MRGIAWWVVAGALLASLAGAAQPQAFRLQAQLATIELPAADGLAVREGLFEVRPAHEGPWTIDLEGDPLRVTQYWVNASSVRDPVSGQLLSRVNEPQGQKEWSMDVDRVSFLFPIDVPQVRLRFASMRGFSMEAPENVRIDSSVARDAMVASRAAQQTKIGITEPYHMIPARAGWAEYNAAAMNGFGQAHYLLDGWAVRLENHAQSVELRLGRGHDLHHPFGSGGHVREVYSFLVLETEGGRHAFPEGARFAGFGSVPHLEWSGPAHLGLYQGMISVESANVVLTDKALDVEGDFRADADFGPEALLAGAAFTMAGTGVASAPLPDLYGGGLAPAEQVGVWSSVAVGALTVAVLGVQTYRAPRRTGVPIAAPPANEPPQPESMGLSELIERAQKTPLDGELQFRLGVELFRNGRPDVGLRALDRSFRLHPPAIMRLLEDPELAPLRDHDGVRQLLGRFQREQQRKVWAGYA